MNTDVRKCFVCIRSVMQFYERYPDENKISLIVLENFSAKVFPDVFRDFPILFSEFFGY